MSTAIMSLKAELEAWESALKAYDSQDYLAALELFANIPCTSKTLTNMGLIYATIGEHEAAIEKYRAATGLDRYLAVAYFQSGVSHFLLDQYTEAHNDFYQALSHLRANQSITYDQLGLKFVLYSAEVQFNKALSRVYMGDVKGGLQDMEEAKRDKCTKEHDVIADAIADQGRGYTVFSVPVGIVYRPSEAKIKSAMGKAKDYMGKAKLVAASHEDDAFTTFTGVTRLERSKTLAAKSAPPPKTSSEMADEDRMRIGVPSKSLPPNPPSSFSVPDAPPGLSRSKSLTSTSSTNVNPRTGPSRGMSLRREPSRARREKAGDNIRTDSDSSLSTPTTVERRVVPHRRTKTYDPGHNSVNDSEAKYQRAFVPIQNTNPISFSRAPSSYYPPTVGRRRTVRRGPSSSVMYTDDEEEEGYFSGGNSENSVYDLKIRVKIHYHKDTRGLTLPPTNASFFTFADKLLRKFNKASLQELSLKFKDEDGEMVSMKDEGDFELAVEVAREGGGKMVIWCDDA